MKLNVDQAAVSRHIRHLDAVYKAISFPWEISNIGAIEALHVVASKHDRKFAADLFRALADHLEQHHSATPPADPAPANDMVDPDRLEQAEMMARALSADISHALDLGKNPPTDPLVISCLNEIGRGWTYGQRLMLCDTDITSDLHILYDEIEKLNAPRGEFDEEPAIDREVVRAVGIRLNHLGGIDAMRAAAEALHPMAGGKVSRLDSAWDGIGEWKW